VPQGTAVVIPAAGATTVEVQDATSGSWWSGAAWVGSAVQLPAGGSASWSFALDQAALTSGHSYATRARTTDSAGNVGSSAIATFAYFVPSKLAFVVQPATTTVNATIAPAVTVAVQDAAGHTAVGDGSTTLTLSVGAGPSGSTLLGGASRPVVAGVATFPGLALDKVGTGYRLLAVATSLTGATSGAFDMTPGPAAKVVFTTQPPATASSGTALTTQPVVTVQDSYGNTVTSSTAPVTLTTSGGTLACTANPRSAVAGVATFAGCALTGTGIRTLTAAASGLTPATSTSVTVGPVVAPPTNVNATKKGTANRTIVKFTASSPTTGVANYTCSIYVNTGGTSTPNAGALIKAVSCTAGGDNNVLVGATYRGTNTIVVIVTANPRANYNGASSTPVVGNVG
jgi:hypothetical protein